MTERIFIGVAWPYASGPLHLGHIAGAYLPADIFARFHRSKGNEVLMVSGSDQHGTPITLKAEAEGKTPAELAGYYDNIFNDVWQKLGISWDLFTTTETANHYAVSQDIFLTLLNNGYIFKQAVLQPYCANCNRFLPDRYIEGKCPKCGFDPARGDQCDNCGQPLNPWELVNPRCRICDGQPVFKESDHFFLKLSAFQEQLTDWVTKQSWRTNVYNFTMRYLNEGLKDRAITRDIDWGIPLPIPGYEGKRLYVWFEAVIGYLSAAKEWAQRQGEPEKWKLFWQQPETKSYYFIGKDNIPFHTLIWPAMLMGYDQNLNLPYDVPANEFLTIEGKKLSTSRNWAVWMPDYLSRYDPDPLRYYLSAVMPETGDTDFSWREFVRRNNDELVATYGNLVNRVLTFVFRNFEGLVPTPLDLDGSSKALLQQTEDTFKKMDEYITACRFKDAIWAAMSLAQSANRYLDDKSPWKTIKVDRSAAATSLYTVIAVISGLKTLLYPFLPFSSQRVHEFLGFSGTVEESGWKFQTPPSGQKLNQPQPLFSKLDNKVIEEETSRLGMPLEERTPG